MSARPCSTGLEPLLADAALEEVTQAFFSAGVRHWLDALLEGMRIAKRFTAAFDIRRIMASIPYVLPRDALED